jgi:hypothetical protein
MSLTTQESTPTSSNIPDLIKIGQIPTNTAIDIETDILDPVIANETFIRFQFQNKGILHSHSKIIFRYQADASLNFCPLGVGIHSLIQRARLAVGTKTVSEIDDFNHYIGYKSAFLSNEHQKEREQFISGRQLAYRPYYNEGTGIEVSASGSFVGRSDTDADKIGLDNGQSLTSSRLGNMENFGQLNLKTHSVGNATYGVEYAISIQDLFPFLYQNQLPLYMMTEPVTIELTLAAQTQERMCISASTTQSTAGTAYPLDLGATQLVADYQYFPQEMMEEYARQNADMTFTYMDYRLAKRSITVNASGSEASTGQLIVNVGAAGRICTKVIQMVSDDTDAGPQEDSLMNDYHAEAMKRIYAGVPATDENSTMTSNLKYNDNFLYPVDVVNPAYQFHNVVTAEGMVPFVSRDSYSNEGGATSTTMVMFNTQGTGNASTAAATHGADDADNASGIVSKYYYQAYKLNRNERINSRGIELYNTWNVLKNPGTDPVTFTQRVYVELVRVATLKGGKMDVFFA